MIQQTVTTQLHTQHEMVAVVNASELLEHKLTGNASRTEATAAGCFLHPAVLRGVCAPQGDATVC